jgi:hypothetical protein
MATDKNPLDTIKTLLTNNWTAANTDGVTPIIDLIYNQPKTMNLSENDFILFYSTNTLLEAAGFGGGPIANVNESARIDIRVGNTETPDDSHFRKVLAEVRRIIFSNLVNPDSNFQELAPYNQGTDLSDRTRNIYRYVWNINLIERCRVFS